MIPREQFIQLMTENAKTNGLDEATARIVAVLFLEPKELSLEELAKKSGYSLSSTSTSIKFMEASWMITKFKKPHSKKIYLKIENDIMSVMLKILMHKREAIIKGTKEKLPLIIEEYKKSKADKQELKIIERYYRDVIIGEKIISEMIRRIESQRRT